MSRPDAFAYGWCGEHPDFPAYIASRKTVVETTPAPAGPRNAAAELVELHGAYVWTCPECGRDTFHRGVTIEREQVEAMVPPEQLEAFEAYQGSWMTAPSIVTCWHCDKIFDVMPQTPPEGDDDTE